MIGHGVLGGGRTQEKEAITQFPYVLEDSQRAFGTHIPVEARWKGPIHLACWFFCFVLNTNIVYLTWKLGLTCGHTQWREGCLYFALRSSWSEEVGSTISSPTKLYFLVLIVVFSFTSQARHRILGQSSGLSNSCLLAEV